MVTALSIGLFRTSYVQKVLCSENICSKDSSIQYVQKVLHLEASRSYVQKVLGSVGSIFRSSYVQKVLCSENICSKGPIFRRFYAQNVLYNLPQSLLLLELSHHELLSAIWISICLIMIVTLDFLYCL